MRPITYVIVLSSLMACAVYMLEQKRRGKDMGKAFAAILAVWFTVTVLVAGFIAVIMAVVYAVSAILS